ncbi:hypothetical protein G647_00053 [Cladophialophora carrionii CBS 160.54]|uniref:Uncharacterized protein n=1 Tax=Cladophialophora carrionii CBS 160.54 TaxID=1279043 RepID=V9DL10_9EURO|nr:uncharacterized protein G647_00053 [Cladophialophora carrionii CBS 160.54]ETI27604.1 hypothetical protein G647_00053 [Cladophialophora carrionii CBS 160.54]
MAEDVSQAPPPGLALDGTADRSTGATAGPSTSTQPAATSTRDGNPASDPDGDTLMTSAAPTATRVPNSATDPAGAPPTPEASPKAIPATTTTTATTTTAGPTEPAGPVPLDSPLRTTPIHPSLPSVKVPETALSGSATDTNPITLQPFTEAELSKYGFAKLRAQIFAAAGTTAHGGGGHHGGALSDREREEIARLRDETAAAVKHRLEEREARVREIEREMEEKEKIREVERKVFRKKLGKDG